MSFQSERSASVRERNWRDARSIATTPDGLQWQAYHSTFVV
jgi:hypothetical protein